MTVEEFDALHQTYTKAGQIRYEIERLQTRLALLESEADNLKTNADYSNRKKVFAVVAYCPGIGYGVSNKDILDIGEVGLIAYLIESTNISLRNKTLELANISIHGYQTNPETT